MANVYHFIALFSSFMLAMGLFRSLVVMPNVPPSLPWVGVRKEILSKSRACIREWSAALRTLKAGYHQFCRKGLPYVLPDPGFRPIVILPQEHAAWMSSQPDPILSVRKAQVGRIALEYLSPGLDFNHDAFIMEGVRKDLTRNLGNMQAAMTEDIRSTVDNAMGVDTESWTEICIHKAMCKGVFKTTSRVLVGSSLCENERYLNYSISFATWLGGAAIMVGQYTPWMLKPFFGYLGALPVYYFRQKALRFLSPVIRERMTNIRRKRVDPTFEFEEPKDLITWITKAVFDNVESQDSSPEFIGVRLLYFTLGAIHTTVMTATNIILDLIASDPDDNFWDQLRAEAAGIFKKADDWTDPGSVSKLSLADSTVRESLRVNPMISRILLREVVPRDGITLPSGHHMPKGTWLSQDTVGVHHDDRFYIKPHSYDPFRFTKKPEEVITAANKETLSDKASIYRNNQSVATASDIYLAFGVGKHSCPGRWLAAHQLKLTLAYITLNYDIQHVAQRPVNQVFGDSIIPSRTATMTVRRRKHV